MQRIQFNSQQSYTKMKKKEIGKKHYSFKRAYLRIPLGDIPKIQKDLCDELRIRSRFDFSKKLNQGFTDPRISVITNVEKVFKKYSIPDPWDITNSIKQ